MSSAPQVTRREFGRLADGRAVHEYTLDNGQGLRLACLDYGGIVTSIWTPDREGRSANIALGFDNLPDYLHRNQSFGVIAGRYANRIAGARFAIDGEVCTVDANETSGNCLHGGSAGFGAQMWEGVMHAADAQGRVSLELRRTSPDGEMGFPGALDVVVRYTLEPGQVWRVDYEARTTRPTLCNLTSHAYFNLAGGGSALDHELRLHASRYTEVDDTGIPIENRSVAGTRFDFRAPNRVGDATLDHSWLLDHPFDGALHPAARLFDAGSGRAMEMFTTEPCIQFYAGKWLDGSLRGHGGEFYKQGGGLCLETQHAPDSPNREGSDWPSTVLRPGEVYRSTTVHKFSVER
ncbi:aldose epimerase family protein [Burkholderiaceae bacterium UC74_6]